MTQTRKREMLREYSEIEAQIFALRKRQEELEHYIFAETTSTGRTPLLNPKGRTAHPSGKVMPGSGRSRIIDAARKLGKPEFTPREVAVKGMDQHRVGVELAGMVHTGVLVRVAKGVYKLAA